MLGVINSLLIYEIVKLKGLSKYSINGIADRKKRNSSISIVTMTLLFIVMTSPSAIGGGYFLEELFSNTHINYLYLMDNISFLYHGLNFFIFGIANKRLYNEIKSMCGKKK